MLPVRWRGLISLKGRWNIARVLCAYAASAGDSQLPAAKQQEELFSTWPSHGLAKRCLLLPNLGCVWTGVSCALSASLSFLSGMAWPLQDVEIRSNAAAYLPQITQLLNNVPRQMLLLLKTNDLLRGIESALHTRASASSFLNMSRCCIRAVST